MTADDRIAAVHLLETGTLVPFQIVEEQVVAGRTPGSSVSESSSRSTLADYLAPGDTQKWHSEYAKEYRDALAHRIPLYVPLFRLTDDDKKRFEEI